MTTELTNSLKSRTLRRLRNAFDASLAKAFSLETDFIIDTIGGLYMPGRETLRDRQRYFTRRPRYKVHFAYGVTTHLIAAIRLTSCYGPGVSDAEHFIPMLETLKACFPVRRVYADPGYWGERNLLGAETLSVDSWIAPPPMLHATPLLPPICSKYIRRWEEQLESVTSRIRMQRLNMESRIATLRHQLVGLSEGGVLEVLVMFNLCQQGFTRLLHADNIPIWIDTRREQHAS